MNFSGDVWITMSELRRRIHRVLREVERGRTFTITRHGRSVVRLISEDAAVQPSNAGR